MKDANGHGCSRLCLLVSQVALEERVADNGVMNARSVPTEVLHFTHINHLPTIIHSNLQCDDAVRESQLLSNEVGNISVKQHRRGRPINVGPRGPVSGYVPFYYAPRSPMMFAIERGSVPTFQEGSGRLIYLVTSLERLVSLGHLVVLTDRNAALDYAEHRLFAPDDMIDDGFIDWELMEERMWADTPADPTRRERRMAEALVCDHVEWAAIEYVVTKNRRIADRASTILAQNRVDLPVKVNPSWYF